jgi:two-component system, NtrC family, response regulator AtoC
MTRSGAVSPDEPLLVGRLLVVVISAAARDRWDTCVESLRAAGHLVHAAAGPGEAIARLMAGEDELAVLVAAAEPALDRAGRELLGRVAARVPVVVAGVPDGERSRALVRWGAHLTTPGCDVEGLSGALDRALRFARAIDREARFDAGVGPLGRMLGAGDAIAPALARIPRAAQVAAPALVIGEVGSGKHIVARAIHTHPRNPRREGPFVKCPLSALPARALREELFGSRARPGVLELAHDGTLFLDDITCLDATLQALLLELLEMGSEAAISPVDGGPRVPADVRLVAGSTLEIHEDRARSGLRDDFLDCITVLPILVPPLRQRPADIAVVATALIDRHAALMNRTMVGLSPAAAGLLQRYHWPGNIRELDTHIERAVRRAPGPAIEVSDLPELAYMTSGRPEGPSSGTVDVRLALDPGLTLADLARRAQVAAEVAAIRRALKLTGGNVTHAARMLGVSRMHLQQRMKRYGLRASS